MRWLDGINGHEFKQILGDGKGQGSLSRGSKRVRHDLETEQQKQDVQIICSLLAFSVETVNWRE